MTNKCWKVMEAEKLSNMKFMGVGAAPEALFPLNHQRNEKLRTSSGLNAIFEFDENRLHYFESTRSDAAVYDCH